MALENGRPDIAQERLLKIITARKSANLPTGIYQQTLDELDLGNTTGAQAGVNYALSMADPDRFKKQVDARTTAAKAPSEVTKSTAEANRAVTEAQQKVADLRIKLQDEPIEAERLVIKRDLEKAQADKAQVDSKYANQIALADIDTKAAALGLTKAQTNEVLAKTRELNVKIKIAALELEAIKNPSGIIPEEKRPEAEAKFRKEYSDQTKGYQDVKAAYGRILSVSEPKTPDEEAAADLALVFNFMKMQDPGSTVNTGEFANAQNSVGVPDRVRNQYNNLLTDARLNPSQRKAFTGQAKNLYASAGQQEDIVRKGIERIAKGYGLNSQNIFYTPTETAPTPPTSPTTPTPTGSAPTAGQRNVTVPY